MSFASSLLGGGGGGGGYQPDPQATTLFNQIIAGNQSQVQTQTDMTSNLNDLVTVAAAQNKALGIAAASRTAAATGGNKWLGTSNMYAGLPGSGGSRQLGGTPYLMGG